MQKRNPVEIIKCRMNRVAAGGKQSLLDRVRDQPNLEIQIGFSCNPTSDSFGWTLCSHMPTLSDGESRTTTWVAFK